MSKLVKFPVTWGGGIGCNLNHLLTKGGWIR